MAVLGTVEIIGRANLAPMATSFARGAKMVDAWSAKVGGSVDKAFAGLVGSSGGKLLKGLSTGLNAVGKATDLTRTALAIGDVYRATKWTEVGFNRLRLAFAGSGEKADALRARTDSLSAGLTRAAAASNRIRFAAFAADLGAFAVKLGIVATRDLAAFASASARVAGGVVGLASAVGRAGASLVGIVPNAARATAALYRSGDASQGAARRTVELYSAWYYAKRSAGGVAFFTGALGSLVRSTATVSRGLVGFSTALAGITWRVAVGGATTFVGVLGRVGSSILSLTTRVGTIAGVGATIAAALGIKAAVGAAHLEEAYNKTEAKFGQYASTVLTASAAMRDAYGTNERTFIDSADAIGAFLKNAGYSQKDAAALGVSFTKLAVDANAALDPIGGIDQAIQKVRSGLSGETEPLKEWGVDLRDAALEAYAFSAGIAKAGKDLTESQKLQARMGLITKGLKDEMGGLAREATGTAAQINEFWGRLDTLSNTVGQTLAPALGSLLLEANTGILALTNGWKENKGAILEWFGVSGSALAGTGEGVGLLTTSLIRLAEAWGWVVAATQQSMAALNQGQSSIAGWVASLANGLADARLALDPKADVSFLRILAEEEGNVATSAQKSAEEWTKSAEARLAQLPAIGTKIADAFKTANAQIEANRVNAEAATKAAEIGKPADLPTAPKKPKSTDLFAGAFTLGSKEATSIALKVKGGGGTDQVVANTKQTAANTKATIDVLGSIDKGIQNLAKKTADAVFSM